MSSTVLSMNATPEAMQLMDPFETTYSLIRLIKSHPTVNKCGTLIWTIRDSCKAPGV